MWDFIVKAYEAGGIQLVVALAAIGANVAQWRRATERERKVDALQDQRVAEAKALVDRVLTIKHEFDELAEKLKMVIEAVVEARESRSGRRGER